MIIKAKEWCFSALQSAEGSESAFLQGDPGKLCEGVDSLKCLKIEELDQKREGRKKKQPGGRLRRRTAGDLGTGVGTRELGALVV